MKCKQCEDKKYKSKLNHINGSAIFEVCECTGLTKEKLEEFVDFVSDDGLPVSIELPDAVTERKEEENE